MKGTKLVLATTIIQVDHSVNTYISVCKNISHERQWFGSRNPQILKSSMCIGSVSVRWEIKFLGIVTVYCAGLPVTHTGTVTFKLEWGITWKQQITTKNSTAAIIFDLHFYLHIYPRDSPGPQRLTQKVDELFWL